MHIGIVGGSIAGCCAAAELIRAGHTVEIFERAVGRLAGQGAGIGLQPETLRMLIDRELLDADVPRFQQISHVFAAKHPSDARFGREALRLSMPAWSMNWGDLYRNLRERVPDASYHAGVDVIGLARDDAERVALRFADGSEQAFELVVFADGYQSLGRALLCPEVEPSYRGYTLWRGIVEEHALGAAAPLDGVVYRIGYRGLAGHAALYRMPNGRGAAINFACYLPLTAAALPEFLVDRAGQSHATSLPPGGMRLEEEARLQALMREQLPSYFADIVAQGRDTFAQPIFTVSVPRCRRGRVCLLGDAGALAPPLTGSGVLKATLNATDLARSLAADADLDAALSGWADRQMNLGRVLVTVGERMEKALVWECPDLNALDPQAALAWWQSAISLPRAV
jgi:2-polyprenyl-6-methoxyphenol hydroxylase-like FAD-dependent oxidoreductase